MTLEFRVLGDIAVLADGRPLTLGGTRQRSVLALLLLNRNRPLATELLADRLWSDEQPLTAIKTVQVYVSRIRHALGSHADRLTSSPTGYRLAVEDDELDAAQFERGLGRARERLASGSADAALTGLEASLALWSGQALGDLATEPFARREADRLEELRLQALEELYELRIAGGAGRDTIGELRRLVADLPERERLWRLLMLALYADGRQGEALAAYHAARRYLADQLGLDPSPELAELERAILTQEAPRPPSASLALATAAAEAIAPASRAEAAAEAEASGRRRRIVTVLRADVAPGARADALDPEVLAIRERRVLDVVRRAVERHGGTINHADHDGVTAVFGLTAAREDDALRAVRAAVELSTDPPPMDAESAALHVGVATGEVLTGSSDAHGSRLAGAPLQTAARLAVRAAANEVLLAVETERLVRGAVTTKPLLAEPGDATSALRLLSLTEDEPIIRRTTTPFVGRAAELHAVLDAFEQVVSEGAPGVVTVIGAPGVGKSRLIAEAFGRISERARILRSRCLPYGDGITYWAIRELVYGALGFAPGDPGEEGRAKLQSFVAGSDGGEHASRRIASIVGLADEPVATEEIPWAVRRFLEILAAERPLVVLVDDIQWAEPILVDLLEHVADLGRGPILLVTVARPELEDVRPQFLARPSLNLIRLDSLSETDARVLLGHLAPELPSGSMRSRILATAEGNPLFVEQFVAYLSDEAADRSTPTDQITPDLAVPPTIGALLAARLDRLPDVERRVLERAAVMGRTFWAGALGELLPERDRAELQGSLARLARRSLIRPERSDIPDVDAYRFRHQLIRDAAYSSLSKRERAGLHERYAGWLEGRSEARSSDTDLIVGYHLEQAYRYRLELGEDPAGVRTLADRSRQLIAPAGLAAEERGDPHAAIALLRRALDLAPANHERIELLIALRSALYLAGERTASDAAAGNVAALLSDHPDEGLEHRRRLSERLIGGVTIPDAQAAYAYYARVGDEIGMVRALEAAVNTHLNDLRFAEADALVDQATAVALKIGRPDRAAAIWARSAMAYPDSSIPVPDALARVRRYLELAGSNGFSRARILLSMGQLEAMNGVRGQWRRHFEEAKAIGHDLGLEDPFGIFAYPMWLGSTELAFGDPARVVALLQQTCSSLDRLGIHLQGGLASAAPLTAQLLLAVGRLDEVEHYAYWGRDIADPEDLDAQVRWRMAIGGLRSSQGRHDEAIALARESLALLATSEAVVLEGEAHMTMARALRAAGHEPKALKSAHEAQRLARAKRNRAALRKIEAFLAGNA